MNNGWAALVRLAGGAFIRSTTTTAATKNKMGCPACYALHHPAMTACCDYLAFAGLERCASALLRALLRCTLSSLKLDTHRVRTAAAEGQNKRRFIRVVCSFYSSSASTYCCCSTTRCSTNIEISPRKPCWGMLDCDRLDFHLAALQDPPDIAGWCHDRWKAGAELHCW